ncbi:MAG: cytochrome [Nocardia sp.]|uniref:cytochrome P450 n=1 Tax=Nocardia sp. TaxID=1821 RepID=UPI002636FBE6|nr:cytochrome P450 [Nocardia sp.]MCU1641614.1 cytochrome [Nocardia sp.]
MTASHPPGTAQHASAQPYAVGPGFGGDEPLEPMYTLEFAQHPHAAYERWRSSYGPLVPVELAPGVPATLVLGYTTAVRILNDPEHFPADPRIWQRSVHAGCPVLPMMEWRPNALRSTGYEHRRYRMANVSALDTVDLYGMRAVVEQIAVPLINDFCSGTGNSGDMHRSMASADLLGQYIYPLVYRVLAFVLGFDDDTNEQVGTGMAMMFDAAGEAEAGSAMLVAALDEHIRRKRARPGGDVTSHLIASGDLSTEELIHQLVTLQGAGSEPQVHLISNALLLMMTDERFAGDLIDGSLSTRDALDEVLFTNPPLANYCITYPPQPILVEGVWLPAHQPVVISMAGCNADPTIQSDRLARSGNRAHLAWSLGPHQCPARQLGYQIAMDAIDYLLDALPELRLAVAIDELVWRPGPFHRALESLPTVFPQSPQLPLLTE